MGEYVEEETPFFQVCPASFVMLLTQQICHLPLCFADSFHLQVYIALARMTGQVDHYQIESHWPKLPLYDNDIFRRSVCIPSRNRFKQMTLALSNRGFLNG